MGLAETAELAVRISLKDNVSAGVRGLQKNLGGLNRSLAQTGRGVGQIGAGLTRAGLVVGGAAIAGIVGAAKAAIAFEDAFAGVRKTINETDLAKAGLTFEDLAKQFRTMATEIPVAATELATIGEAAGALGIRAQDIEEFTRTVALLGATTDLTTETAAEALGKIGTILDFTGQEFEDFADVLVNLGNTGASVESDIIEITKRFAASGKQAGLSVPQIAAWASAISSAGAAPEAAGSSLSRLFGNLITEIALGTVKGKNFAAATGKSFKDFSKIVKDDTNGAMILFLRSLNKLDKFGQQELLEDVGITNVRDRNAILLLSGSIDKNLIPAIQNAENSSGALGVEAAKRFDTIASKLKLLKNNFIEAGITIGEGFLPALGRATDKLIAFLKVDANKASLKAIGEDIGKAIDGINWDDVLAGATKFYGLLKGALSFAKLMFDAFMALPGPIKEATAGFLVLNKLSGGLIAQGAGNVIGGLGGAAIQGGASRVPGLGRLFAQPVFVTNFPPGFGSGVPPVIPAAATAAAAGAAAATIMGGTILAGAAGISFGALLNSPQFARSNQLAARGLSPAEIAAVKYYQADAQYQQQALKHLGSAPTRADFNSGIAKLNAPAPVGPQFGPPTPAPRFGPPVPAARFDAAQVRARAIAAGHANPSDAAIQATLTRNLERLQAVEIAKTEAVRAAVIATDSRSETAGIRMAIAAAKPAMPVTNVTVNVSPAGLVTKYVTISRAGPVGSSRQRHAIGTGPLP